MKYTIALLALTAGVFAIPQEASSVTSAPTVTATPEVSPQISCVYDCKAGDVTCQAACLGAAHPNSAQVVDTTECAAKCDQGDGSPEATDKYSNCVQGCIASHFPSSQTVAQGVGAAASSAAVSGASNAANPTASAGSSPSGTGSQATGASASGSGASAQATGAANANSVQIVGAGLAGLMAMFAL